MLDVDGHGQLKLAEHVTLRILDVTEGVGFLLDSRTGAQYDLGQVEITIVEQLRGGLSQDKLASFMCAVYPEEDPAQLTEDVLAFVQALQDASLLAVVNEAHGAER